MELAETVAMAGGLAWASGLRLYAVLFVAGLLSRLGYIDLPDSLEVLEHPLVLMATGLMLLVEFLADKVPAFDSVWDGIHTFVRIPAGAALAALALADHDPAVMAAAAILGGAVSAGTHATKAGGRALINTSPEPFSNWAVSLSEDALSLGGLWLAFAHPIAFLVGLLVFLLAVAWLLPRMVRGVAMLFHRMRDAV